MSLPTSVQDNVVSIRPQGRFDFSVHREFREAVKVAIANAAIKEIQIELGSVDYMDSSALGMLLLALEQAKAVGKTVSLAGATGAVKAILDISNFQKLFVIK